jgi:hypothetical protein
MRFEALGKNANIRRMAKEKKKPLNQEIGLKLPELRKGKSFSQGRAGLLRCYVSRVEKAHTIYNVETRPRRFSGAFEIPLYRYFTDGNAANVSKLPRTR